MIRHDRIDFADYCQAPTLGPELSVRMMPGKVLVGMQDPRTRVGALLLPDELAEMFRPDMGWVLARGPDVELDVGARVVVDPYAGKWMKDFRGWELTRFFGDESRSGSLALVPWWEHILAEVDKQNTLIPTGNNLFVELAPIEAGLVLVPEGLGERDGTARILAVGPLVSELSPGDRVVYHAGGLRAIDFCDELAATYGCGANDLGLLSEDNVYCVLEDEHAGN